MSVKRVWRGWTIPENAEAYMTFAIANWPYRFAGSEERSLKQKINDALHERSVFGWAAYSCWRPGEPSVSIGC